jgi:regulator of protease activity HflC (stomatin/prohibitin superfamily)
MKEHPLALPSAVPQSRWRQFTERRLPNIVIFLMITALIAAVILPFMVVNVPSGQVGVLWRRFGAFSINCWCFVGRGTVLKPSELSEEGLHIIWPWNKLFLYDLRLQNATGPINAISQDGVRLVASISVRFQLKHDAVPQLHKFIGPNYVNLLLLPEIGSRAREAIARYNAEEVYSTARQVIEDAIRQSGQAKLGQEADRLVQPKSTDQFHPEIEGGVLPDLQHAIEIFDTLILSLELPEAVVAAINHKIEQLYVAQEYIFRIERERRESERKRIEAAGIRDFQQIVSEGMSDSYLRWRGIEATLQLAQSNNAKIVIIGNGKDGVPIILGNVDTPVPAHAGAPTIAPPLEKVLGEPSDGKRTPPPAATPEELESFLPRSLSDVEAMLPLFRRTPRLTDSDNGSPPNHPDGRPATKSTP